MAAVQAIAATSLRYVHQLTQLGITMVLTLCLFVLRPIQTVRAFAVRMMRRAWSLFLAPMALAVSVALLLGFLFGFVLSQVAMYLEVFPKRRRQPSSPHAPTNDKSNQHVRQETEQPNGHFKATRFDSQSPAVSSPPALEPSAFETEDDSSDWKDAPFMSTSEDESDFIGYAEREEAAADQTTIVTGPDLPPSPKYEAPVGYGFYAQFRPTELGSASTLEDDADDDGYTSPARSRSRSEASVYHPSDTPILSSAPTPADSPLRSRPMSRVQSLTQIYKPIYEEEEA